MGNRGGRRDNTRREEAGGETKEDKNSGREEEGKEKER